MNLCSLWDSRYHKQGLALLRSLQTHAPDAFLWVLALDDQVANLLHREQQCAIIKLSQFEGEGLKEVRQGRTWQEYCWTLGSVFSKYVFSAYDLDELAYIDADMFLFGSLDRLYAEVGQAPVAIIPHRWSPQHAKRLKPNGTYNVSWVRFSGVQGLMCLKEWADQCVDWCFYRIEGERMADQGYLEHWPERWGAHVVKDIGVGLAPWNQEQYQYIYDEGRLYVAEYSGERLVRVDPVTLYHFHSFGGPDKRCGYPLSPLVAKHLYEPYEGLWRTL